jgi:hypothetical protein
MAKSSSTLPQENLSSQEDCDPSSSMNNGKPACKETPTSAPSHSIQANNLSTGLTNAEPRTANRVGLEEALSSFPSSSEQDIQKSAPSISLQSNPLSTGLVNSASKSITSLPQLDISSAQMKPQENGERILWVVIWKIQINFDKFFSIR